MRPGETIELLATGIDRISDVAAAAAVSLAGLQIEFGGLRLRPVAIRRDPNLPGVFRIRVQVPRVRFGDDEVDVALWASGRKSNTIELPVTDLSAAPAPAPEPEPTVVRPTPPVAFPGGRVTATSQAF